MAPWGSQEPGTSRRMAGVADWRGPEGFPAYPLFDWRHWQWGALGGWPGCSCLPRDCGVAPPDAGRDRVLLAAGDGSASAQHTGARRSAPRPPRGVFPYAGVVSSCVWGGDRELWIGGRSLRYFAHSQRHVCRGIPAWDVPRGPFLISEPAGSNNTHGPGSVLGRGSDPRVGGSRDGPTSSPSGGRFTARQLPHGGLDP
jgi:hypothetical protein